MTPDEIYEVTHRFELMVRTFDRTRSFREFNAALENIVGGMLAYADAGGEHAALVRDRFNMVASDADAAGLYRHEQDLTQDHSPADQHAYIERLYSDAPAVGALSEAELLAEGRRLGEIVVEWVSLFDATGKTFRELWNEYASVAADFEGFLRRDDLPERVGQNATMVRDMLIQRGFEPAAYLPQRALDDLIRDPAGDR